MFCTYCGNKLAEDAVYCEQCGFVVGSDQKQKSAPPTVIQERVTVGNQAPGSAKRSNKMRMLVIGIVAAVGLVGFIMVMNSMTPTAYLNDYLTISFEGYDTRGTAIVSFDLEAFQSDYENKIQYKHSSPMMEGGSYCYYLYNSCIQGTVEPSDMLSEGDVVTYTWECDDDRAAAEFGIRLAYKDLSVKVTGLEPKPTVEVDPFENIEIQYAGIAPYGYIHKIINHSSSPYLQDVRYVCDTQTELENGDIVTIQAIFPEDTLEYLHQQGVGYTRTENTYQVEGFVTYLSSLEELTQDNIATMQKQAEDAMHAYVDSKWSKEEVLEDMEYLGCYLLIAKEFVASLDENQLILVYKVTASDRLEEYEIHDQFEYYYAVVFRDLIKYADGTVSYLLMDKYEDVSDEFSRKVFYGEHSYDYKTFYYKGYETFDSMVSKIVTSKKDQYEYESDLTKK